MNYYTVTLDNIDEVVSCYVITDSEEKARSLAASHYSASEEQVVSVEGPWELDEDTVLAP